MNKMRFNLSVQCKTFCHLSFLLFCMFVKMDGQQFVEAFRVLFFLFVFFMQGWENSNDWFSFYSVIFIITYNYFLKKNKCKLHCHSFPSTHDITRLYHQFLKCELMEIRKLQVCWGLMLQCVIGCLKCKSVWIQRNNMVLLYGF